MTKSVHYHGKLRTRVEALAMPLSLLETIISRQIPYSLELIGKDTLMDRISSKRRSISDCCEPETGRWCGTNSSHPWLCQDSKLEIQLKKIGCKRHR
mmetsp:Transcript_1488/g.2717  ORF Transcript_1488/g.2717 Transcript_1488/m.2717 type:complete len:97 (-) Transcript_1488:458-748(-)